MVYAIIPVSYEVDVSISGFEHPGGKCQKCGRPHEAIVGPLAESIEVSKDHDIFWTTNIHNESIKGAILGLWCSKKDKVQIRKIFGKKFEYVEAL